MPASKADLIFHSILKAAPMYKPCLTCSHSWFNVARTDHMGWCRNVPPLHTPRPVDEVHTCAAWKQKIDE
jgi:hypothetical protein